MFDIRATPGKSVSYLLPVLPFLISILFYIYASGERHKENPKDKLVPTVGQMAKGFGRTAFEPDRKGDYRLWLDTWASTKRIAISMVFIFLGVFIGLYMGMFPYLDKLLHTFFLFFDKIPALAVLPILFIVFGLGEVSKVALIVIGVLPTIVLDTYIRVKAVPKEQVIKAMTLNASTQEIVYRVVFPKIIPQVLDTIRLNFKAVILFLIAGEALAATAGLGYRIFVVRRYIAMDIIIPYVIWISLLAFMVDFGMQRWIKYRYRWLNK